MAKFDVQVQLGIAFTITIEAEDETDAAHKIIASNKDWIHHAAEDVDSTIDTMTLKVAAEELFADVEAVAGLRRRERHVVVVSDDQVNDLMQHLWNSMTDEQRERYRHPRRS